MSDRLFHKHQAAQDDALVIRDLDVVYRVRGRDRKVISGLNLSIKPGEAYGLVGESGCGKSTVALTAVRYLPGNGRVSRGSISIAGRDLLSMNDADLRRTRSGTVAMVYQDPGRALNPSIRIGRQLAEVFELQGQPAANVERMCKEMLAKVRIVDPARVMGLYPHQLSGGMQQRVSIAMALGTNPKLLILDEPTTGLDATVEAEVLDLVAELRREYATSVLFISHNIAVVSRICDRAGVLYSGKLVEEGTTGEIFGNSRHPYTVGLLRCLPQLGQNKGNGRLDTIPGYPVSVDADTGCVYRDRCALAENRCGEASPPLFEVGLDGSAHLSRCFRHEVAQSLPRSITTPVPATRQTAVDRSRPPLLAVKNLSKHFGQARALAGIDIELWHGETLGLVGESGSGKTTLARILTGIQSPDAGSDVTLDGTVLPKHARQRSRAQLKALQIIFQNPDSALNQSHSVGRIVGRALSKLGGFRGKMRRNRLLALTNAVRLADRYLSMRPRQLSGGLKQRVAIARTFAGEPSIVVCDEPTSALDVSVQANILNLLVDLQAERKVSYIFISHDLGVVRYLADRIAVLYLGQLMEIGPAERVFSGPHHPYTEALLSAVTFLGGERRERIVLSGDVPSSTKPPTGCVFHTRCPRKLGTICEEKEPPLMPGAESDHHLIRCHIPFGELARSAGAAAPRASAVLQREDVG